MNLIKMNPANASPISEAKPRHRATATTATAKITVSTINGVRRSKSANWNCAGWSSIGGTRVSLTTWSTSTPEE